MRYAVWWTRGCWLGRHTRISLPLGGGQGHPPRGYHISVSSGDIFKTFAGYWGASHA
jgi:hypothetical protein